MSFRQKVKSIPGVASSVRIARGNIKAIYYKAAIKNKNSYLCPICNYRGPFSDYKDDSYPIHDTACPRCDLYERHRLQFLVMQELAKKHDLKSMSALHFAPEPQFKKRYEGWFESYSTADIEDSEVDYRVDLRKMQIPNSSYHIVYASHVLEHVDDDNAALEEIYRILKPGGFAVLPVPVVSPFTVEYPGPNKYEFGHVRAPGVDYFDRYKEIFQKVEVWDSGQFPSEFQLYTYEDRSNYPSETSPHRMPMEGEKFKDYVPVCYKF